MATLNLISIVAGALGVLALLFFVFSLVALRRRRVFRCAFDGLFGLLLLAVAALFGALAVATHGYRALTREDVVVVVHTEPVGVQRFTARFQFPDGRERRFDVAGDELYVDAHIVKWKPIANFIGLHTAYELDRVAGRYSNLKDEQSAARTIYGLSESKPLDIFDLRRRYTVLAPLLDAEYGSATFIAADKPQAYEIRVSTTGLLIRRIEPPR